MKGTQNKAEIVQWRLLRQSQVYHSPLYEIADYVIFENPLRHNSNHDPIDLEGCVLTIELC